MARYDGSIRINTNINTDGIRRGESSIRGSMSRISNAAKNMMTVLTSAFVVGKVAQFGKEILNVASDFEAMEAQFSQVFGELESVASESLSRVAGQAGIMENRMKSSFTKIAAFAKTTGMDTASSLKLSERAMVAVADSAAFYDRSLEETTEYLQSFLKGNYENDAALGLSATEFTRNAAANKLYGKSFIELSEAQKQLTLLAMVEDANRLSGALGQAAREADTWTNQTGNLSRAWANLKANIGKLILPIAIQAVKSITNVINSLNAMISKLSNAAGAFRSFSELITGNKPSAGTVEPTSESPSGYEEAAASAESLADATNDVADATNNAKKANKGYLSGLDEIKRYDDRNEGNGESGIGDISSGIGQNVDYGNLAEGETIIDRLGSSIEPVIKKLKELAGLFKKGFFEGLGGYKPRLEELKSDILSIGRTLIDIFTDPEVLASADGFANQLAYSLGQVVGSIASIGITIAQNLVGGIEKYLTQNTERIKQYIISMFDIGTEISAIIGNFSVAFADIFSVFGSDTAQQITGNLIGIFAEVGMMISENAAKLGRDILNMITQPIIDNKDKIKDAIAGILEAIEPFTSGILTAVQTVRDAVSDIYNNHLKPLFDSIANGLSETIGKLLDGYNEYIVPVLQGLGERFKELMEGPFRETVDKVAAFIGKLIDAVKLLWENVLVPFFSWIADNIYPTLAPIIKFIGNTCLAVFKSIIKIIGGIADALGGVIDFIVGVFTGDWKKAWEGIKGIFSGIWDSVKGIFGGIWEVLKSLVENGISFIRNLISNAWNGIKSVFGGAAGWFKDRFFDAVEGVKSVFSGIGEFFSGVWDGITSAFGNIAGWFKDKFSAAWQAVKNVFSAGGKIFSGIKDGILDGLKAVINALIDGINAVIAIPFNGINWALESIRDVNILGFTPFDWISTIDVPQIPKLATGAVIPANKEFLAVLGDQKHGTNIETPEALMRKAFREELRNELKGMQMQGSGVMYNFNAYINRRVLFEELITEAKLRQTVSGRNPFELA